MRVLVWLWNLWRISIVLETSRLKGVQMHYFVLRNGQTYGPYTLEDLRSYVQSGNVLLSDLAKNEAMPEWLPVQSILGSVGASPASSSAPYQTNQAPMDMGAYPDPPSLSWGLVLLFSILTCGLFMVVWNIIIGVYVKRIQPKGQGVVFYIAGAVLLFINSSTSFGLIFAMQHHHMYGHHPFASALGIAGWVIRLVGLFMMKASLEEHFNQQEPIGLRLSSPMTLLFGGLYLQYHLTRISEMKRALRYSGAGL